MAHGVRGKERCGAMKVWWSLGHYGSIWWCWLAWWEVEEVLLLHRGAGWGV